MSTEFRPAHSPLGASGAERWMNCAGSVALLNHLDLPPSDEPDYRRDGTAAHAAIEKCAKGNLDAWEVMGEAFNGVEINQEIANAIQTFLDEVAAHVTPASKVYTEFGIDAPDFHKDFYGTLDCGIVTGSLMVIRDYKHGEGIMVDVEENPQIMYYAYGLLRHHPEVVDVSLGIVQPRGYHPDGAIRVWLTTADHIRTWAENVLKPAMVRTAMDNDLAAGDWCRFCPAKLVCPLMVSLFGAAMQSDPSKLVQLTDEAVDRDYTYLKAVKHYVKAFEADLLRRLTNGVKLANAKLVNKKADRVWKSGAAELAKASFGDEAFEPLALKSPAQLSATIGEAGKLFAKEYAYTPQTGYTVAPMNDKRPAAKVMSSSEAFAGLEEAAE
jgi:uncharacterized protein DUF2800